MTHRLEALILGVIALSISGCATPDYRPEVQLADARLNPETVTEHTLKLLPGPLERIPIAVYGVADQTGSFKPSEGGQTLSRAVTQAPTPILIKALQDAGNRRWFSVIERENLQNILRERQIILDMRKRYLGETELNREALPALKFAGVLIEGAITGYDTNTVTGGAGARYLGIGGSTQYREDAVSVYLRAVSVKTGEVLISISSEQRVASIAASGNAFKFVAFQELLEAEAGLTMNQPRHLAVRQAFEKAVYGMIVEGSELGLWSFRDDVAGQAAVAHYRSTYASAPKKEYDGVLPDAFYAARKRDIQRIQTAADAERRELAALEARRTSKQRAKAENLVKTQSNPVADAGTVVSGNPEKVTAISAPPVKVVVASQTLATQPAPTLRNAEPEKTEEAKPEPLIAVEQTESSVDTVAPEAPKPILTASLNAAGLSQSVLDAMRVVAMLEAQQGTADEPSDVNPDTLGNLIEKVPADQDAQNQDTQSRMPRPEIVESQNRGAM